MTTNVTNVSETRELSVTIKYPESARYKADGSWLVFRGSPATIIEDISTTFGIAVDGNTVLCDLVVDAQRLASGGQVARNTLGGSTLPAGTDTSSPAAEDKPEVDPLFKALEELESTAEHTNFWADNKAEIQANDELLAAWKVKGRALKDAASS